MQKMSGACNANKPVHRNLLHMKTKRIEMFFMNEISTQSRCILSQHDRIVEENRV
jgi:hypothetical protein